MYQWYDQDSKNSEQIAYNTRIFVFLNAWGYTTFFFFPIPVENIVLVSGA